MFKVGLGWIGRSEGRRRAAGRQDGYLITVEDWVAACATPQQPEAADGQ